ncbi:MAG: LL-diaminopimelate aminotransferase [Candidatus Omnitrophica bacterium]|nr:LL-diaminopimelate aminotransferase [Candidatus Omnitrophota bacterium]
MENIRQSERLNKLPPYLFFEIDKLKNKARQGGRDIIDLGVGDPDRPPPKFICDALCEALKDPNIHRYAFDLGQPEFRAAVSKWYKKRFNVELDPEKEVLPLIGSKEGIAHVPLAFVNPRDWVLVPEPCYPPYKSGSLFAGANIEIMPLIEKNSFLPDLSAVKKASKARLMFINYPNNPTAAVAGLDFFQAVVDFAEKNNIIVCHDAAYSELAFDGVSRPASFLAAEGAKAVGIEFHSLSKTFNMTGWRIGFACGNADIIAGLAKVKSNIDSGIFNAIQRAGVAALNTETDHLENMNQLYKERRDALIDGLASIGWKINKPKATFYVWAAVPKAYNSMGLSQRLLEDADIVVTPGVGFGKNGEGYVRFALTVPTDTLKEAVKRIGKVL